MKHLMSMLVGVYIMWYLWLNDSDFVRDVKEIRTGGVVEGCAFV